MRRRRTALGVLLLLPLPAVAAVTAAAAVPATAVAAPAVVSRAPGETGKYYVVGPAVDGQREYLFAIAAKTLGDGNRYREIFALNEGRLQPDGRRMTDVTRVEPGWILALPRDAKGPDVRVGALPAPSPSAKAPAPSPPPAKAPAASSSPTADAATPTAARPGPAESAPSNGLPELSAIWSPTGLRVALVALAVLLLFWAQVALRSRHRAPRAPGPGDRRGTGAAPESTPIQAASAAADPPSPTVTGPATSGVDSADLPVSADPHPRPVPVALPAPAPQDRAAPAVPAAVVTALSSVEVSADDRAAGLRPPAPANPFATLVTRLTCGPDPAHVRLIGARPARWGSPYGWLADGERHPPSSAPVVLGGRDGRLLWVDLAVAPDVLTIQGELAACRRYALTLLDQLSRETDVIVAGDALGDTTPEGCRRVDAVEDVAAERSTTRVRVLICGGADAAKLWGALRVLPQGHNRTVPIVIGAGPAARWSLRLGAPAAAGVGR
ncbi:hypothetical protein ACLQ26_26210 [Micromonospora sp. DT43]|uniref:hypothetical protein n=1 Tax=Micromonospora sp. DT43 TaxID=3393440 RepID=UPI003CEA8676